MGIADLAVNFLRDLTRILFHRSDSTTLPDDPAWSDRSS